MNKFYSAVIACVLLGSLRAGAQNVVAGRMNEVFSKTILSNTLLSNPWEITYGPDDSLWVTDAKNYTVYKVSPVTGAKRQILDLSNTSTFTPSSFRRTFASTQSPWPQGGLAGLAIHPDFMNASTPKKYVYISYVHQWDSNSVNTNGGYFFTNWIVRFTYNTTSGLLESPVALCDTLPGSNDHNSQRMIIVPVNGVNYLFYASGDMGAGQLASAMRKNYAQTTASYQGKILRFNLEPDGDPGALDQWVPNDNPYGANAVWCMGIRNNQGFAYDSVRNILYGSSHGPYSDDEVNIIEPSRNYGHPLVIGYAADHNYDGSSAGAHPAASSSLAVITDEVAAAAAIGSSYKDPLLAGYPTTQANINNIWNTNPGNNGWPSEAWSGLGLYNYSAIPGWKNSLLMAGLKWGRIIRTRLDNTGMATLPSGTMTDTVINFDGSPRYRDMAFGPDGKDIYFVMESGTSGASPAGTGTNNPLLGACASCIQKFTFLGYNDVSGTSSISSLVPIATGKPYYCENANTININSSNTNLWVPITDTLGNIVAEIKANGNLLGDVTTTLFKNGGAVREQSFNKTLYLDRNITITPQVQPSSAVGVRLYLTNAEFNALKAATNSVGQPSGVVNISDLAIFKNTDACTSSLYNAATAMITTNQAAFGAGGYAVQTNVNSFSTFYMASVTSLLPLHSLSFTGSIVSNASNLRWVTEDEQATRFFTVERSINNRDFNTIGTQVASSTPGQVIYAFTDSSLSRLPAGFVYYRLRLTDVSGRTSYSSVVILNAGSAKSIISIRPNPFVNNVTVDVNASVAEKADWQITDISGKTIMQHSIILTKGYNEMTINTSSLKTGIYYLKLSGASINQSVKLQKL
jgi:PQQ-dependent dehydrogenase (s-GDH family)